MPATRKKNPTPKKKPTYPGDLTEDSGKPGRGGAGKGTAGIRSTSAFKSLMGNLKRRG